MAQDVPAALVFAPATSALASGTFIPLELQVQSNPLNLWVALVMVFYYRKHMAHVKYANKFAASIARVTDIINSLFTQTSSR